MLFPEEFKDGVMSLRKIAFSGIILSLLLAGTDVYSQEFWAEDVDIDSLDIQQVRSEYSLWTLLSACAGKSTAAKSKVQVEAYYINPITYVHLRGSENDTLKSPERLKKELKEIFDSQYVIYVVLKTPDEESLVRSEDWNFIIRTVGKLDYEPKKIDATRPELVFGYTGSFYQTTILLFFGKNAENSKRAFDISAGDNIVATNKVQKIKEEIKWVAGPGIVGTAASNPKTKIAFKVVVSILFVLLAVICAVTRPGKAWFRKKA